MQNCSKCNFELETNFKFCPSCGDLLKKFCGDCTKTYNQTFNYCTDCGSLLQFFSQKNQITGVSLIKAYF